MVKGLNAIKKEIQHKIVMTILKTLFAVINTTRRHILYMSFYSVTSQGFRVEQVHGLIATTMMGFQHF